MKQLFLILQLSFLAHFSIAQTDDFWNTKKPSPKPSTQSSSKDDFWSTKPSASKSSSNFSSSSNNDAKAVDCQWREREVMITILGNDELWLNCDVTAYTCERDGRPSNHGDFIIIKNRGKALLEYRSSPPGTYETPNTKTFQRGTTSNAFYLPLGAGESRIIDVVDYRNKKEKYLPTHAVINVKYCKPTNKPTQADQTSLLEFKENQKKYIIATKDCGDNYYFAVQRGLYTAGSGSSDFYYTCTCSNIFKSNETIDARPSGLTVLSLPRDDFNNNFNKQKFIKDIDYKTTVGKYEMAGLGGDGRSALYIIHCKTKEEAESKRAEFLDADKFAFSYERSSWNYATFQGKIDNSIFTFNDDIVCVENY